MQSLCTPVGGTVFIRYSDLAFRLKFLLPPGKPIFLDVYLSLWHGFFMAKNIVKVSGGKSSFRIIIPCKIIEELGWIDVEYVVIKKIDPNFLEIRRLFDDEKPEGQNC